MGTTANRGSIFEQPEEWGRTREHDPRLYVLTGPPGAGKNTIAAAYAASRERCAVIDVDLVRWMVLQPHKAPWNGEEGRAQQLLGVHNACLLAKSFLEHRFEVIIRDVLTPETAKVYRDKLAASAPTVVLLPTFDEVKRRNAIRPPRLKESEVVLLYDAQASFAAYDERIDNTHLTAAEVAERLVARR